MVLALVTLLVFGSVARNDFVNYDDADYVTANSHVLSGLSWPNVVWAFTTRHASNWHPLTWLSHMLDCQLFGQHAGAHHLISVGFHIANTILLFLALRRMTGALWRSALVAALFALHPLHVESVAWVSERKDVLSAFFFLLTLMAYARYAEASGTPQAADRSQRTLWYILVLVLFALGLMSKPMLVTLPFVLVLLDYWPLERLAGDSIKAKALRLGALIWEKVPLFSLSLLSSVITFFSQQKGGAVSTGISLPARIANALVSYLRYLGKLFWPDDLSVLYPHPGQWPATLVLASGGCVLALSAAVILLARRRPYLVVGWLWFIGMLVPAIGLIQVGIQSMADRYTYLPLIGLFIMLVWGFAEAVSLQPRRATGFAFAAGLCLAACGLLSARQIGYWRNSETLFRRATGVTRNNYLAYNNLGFYLSGQGRTEEAMENYRKALEINPSYEDAQNNMGYALAGRKKYLEAIAHYEVALRIRPEHIEVHNNLANALADTGRIDEAIEHYLFVLQRNPEHGDAHNNFGVALAMQGKLEDAIGHFRAAIRFKPKDASAHSNLGNALAAQHKLDEAIKEYGESLRLNPNDAQPHNNLANALAERGKLEEAVGHYTEALRLQADNPEAHFNLGVALARQGKQEAAVEHWKAALKLKPDYTEARKQLEAIRPAGEPKP